MENIIPAIPNASEKPLKELTPQEFQQMLSFWSEEKGIVSNLKSYFKFQMINVLKNTVIGENIKKSTSQTYTLSQQALHLVVAEYLLQNQCHYSLSLFCSEVKLSNILPQTKSLFNMESMNKRVTNIFDKKSLGNVLELLEISKNSDEFKKIFEKYFESDTVCLLTCLVNLFNENASGRETTPNDFKITDDDLDDDFIKNISHIVYSSKVPLKQQNQLLHNIKLCYELKTKSFESQCVSLITKFKKELDLRDRKLRECYIKKKSLEKKVFKAREEKILNEKLPEEKPIQCEKVIQSACSLDHCNEECRNISKICESYRKDVEILKSENRHQKEEIEKLILNSKDLLKEFNACQSKINLVSSKIKNENVEVIISNENLKKDTEYISITSDSITEEVLQQARQKLKWLEEESEELDLRFSNFVIK